MHVPVDRYTINHVVETGFTCGNWTNEMTEYEYLGIQDIVRKKAESKNLDPICYEMRYIWIADAGIATSTHQSTS